jgi:glycosyltransferase involved in cell wall biosynthesis
LKTIVYLFRHQQAGFSIEGLFNQLAAAVGATQMYAVRKAYAPQSAPTLRGLWANLRFARKQKAALYHITGDIHYIALALPRKQTVLTIHDCVSLQRYAEAGNQFKYYLIRWLYYELPLRRLHYVTTISEKSRQELIRFLGPTLAGKVRIISNHYNPAFTPVARHFNAQKPVILHIGTAAHKNLDRLVEALAGISCQLVIVGQLTTSQHNVLKQAKLDFINKQRLTTAQVIDAYRQCDLVTFISTYEGFGLPILEANATGRVVLTSDISPLREVAASAAHLVDPYSVTAIRAGVLKLIEDAPYRQQLIAAGYQNASQYTVEKAAQQYRTLYEEMLRGPASKPSDN